MILTCPSCSMRFLVSEGAIGPKGRRVRCANCGHEWRQEAEQGLDEELFGEAPSFLGEEKDDLPSSMDDDIDDFQSILRKEIESTPIPAGVHPDLDDPVLAQLQKNKAAIKLPSGERAGGFVVAGVVCLLVAALFLLLQPQISRAWPPSNLIYDLVGMKPVLPGEGLTLDNLQAQMNDGKITMKGDELNMKSKPVKVPAIMASIVDADNKVIDQLLIAPPVATLKAEGQVAFDAVYPKIPDGAKNVNFAFSYMKTKTKVGSKKEKAVDSKEVPAAAEASKEAGHSASPENSETSSHEDVSKVEQDAPQHPAPHH